MCVHNRFEHCLFPPRDVMRLQVQRQAGASKRHGRHHGGRSLPCHLLPAYSLSVQTYLAWLACQVPGVITTIKFTSSEY